MNNIILYIKEIENDVEVENYPFAVLNKIASYGSKKKRRESLNGLYLLERALKDKGINQIDLLYTEKGKPYLNNSKYKFNISHSHEYAVCGISNNEIGVDIEKFNAKILNVKSKITLYKTNYSNTQEEIEHLTKIWALKESFVKYLGIGLTIDLKKIKIEEAQNHYILQYNNSQAFAKTYLFKDYIVSICSKDKFQIKINILEEVK